MADVLVPRLEGAPPTLEPRDLHPAIRGAAAQCHRLRVLSASQPTRKHQARPGSDSPGTVGLDGEIPALRLELEAVARDDTNRRPAAGGAERQIVGRNDPEEPAEGPVG